MNYGAVGGEAVATSNDQYYEEVIQRVQMKYYSDKEALINQPCDIIKKGEEKRGRKPLEKRWTIPHFYDVTRLIFCEG